MTVRIGVIADTHGHLDGKVFGLYEGVSLILHGGDVGDPRILDELSQLAPVLAVRGNVDEGPGLSHLPESISLSVAGVGIYMTHILTPPGAEAPADPVPPGTRVAIFGHSHQPYLQEAGARQAPVLYFNPASAGRKRFRNPRLLGLLSVSADGIPHAEHLDLE
mgnify:CR=1 FL=1